MSKQRRVEVDAEELQVRVGLDARVGLGAGASDTDATATVAHTGVWHRATGWQGNADTITTAGVSRAGIDTLALDTSESDWAIATELAESQVSAATVVHARVRGTAHWHISSQVASLSVGVEDQVLRAVHDGELAESVADDERGWARWVSN